MRSRVFRKTKLRSRKNKYNKSRNNKSRKNRKYQQGGESYNLSFKLGGPPNYVLNKKTLLDNINNFLNGSELANDKWLNSNPMLIGLLTILRKIKKKLPLTPDEIDKISILIKFYCNPREYITESCDNAKMLLVFDKMNKGEALNTAENELKNKMSLNGVTSVKLFIRVADMASMAAKLR